MLVIEFLNAQQNLALTALEISGDAFHLRSKAQISALGAAISNLTKLEILNLSTNCLKCLDKPRLKILLDSIAKCENLRELDLSFNNFESCDIGVIEILGDFLVKLKNLRHLILKSDFRGYWRANMLNALSIKLRDHKKTFRISGLEKSRSTALEVFYKDIPMLISVPKNKAVIGLNNRHRLLTAYASQINFLRKKVTESHLIGKILVEFIGAPTTLTHALLDGELKTKIIDGVKIEEHHKANLVFFENYKADQNNTIRIIDIEEDFSKAFAQRHQTNAGTGTQPLEDSQRSASLSL